MKSPYYWHLLLSNISSFFVAVPLVFGCLRWRYLKVGEKLLLFLMAISLLVEILGFLIRDQHENNLYVYHVYTILEFLLLSAYYSLAITSRRVAFVIKVMTGPFLAVALFDFLTNGYREMDNLSTATESICLIIYAGFFFYFLLKDPIYPKILAIPSFWINAAILLYFSGNLFLFIFSNYLESHSPKMVYCELWDIHSALNITFYLLITLGFWKTKQ